MRIAILGATSQIAKDLVLSFSTKKENELVLFGRNTEIVYQWLSSVGLTGRYQVSDYAKFTVNEQFDAIINFVGSGNPAQTAAMGALILDVTLRYDEMVLNYLQHNQYCKYIFLSSGAVFGSNFDEPVDENTKALIPINNLQPQNWYAVSKLYAECRHRASPHLHIVDVRIFNYFSHTQDMSARFFITDIVRAIEIGETLITSADNIVRDFIGPKDFYQLVSLILVAPPINNVFDCYTQAPVDKMTLLLNMKEKFGLAYEVSVMPVGVNATGLKINYFSKNRRAGMFRYEPSMNSLESVLTEVRLAKKYI